MTAEPGAPRRRGERVVPSEVATVDPALAAVRHREQTTAVATRRDEFEELTEGANPGVLRRICRDLVDCHDRSRVTVGVGTSDQ